MAELDFFGPHRALELIYTGRLISGAARQRVVHRPVWSSTRPDKLNAVNGKMAEDLLAGDRTRRE